MLPGGRYRGRLAGIWVISTQKSHSEMVSVYLGKATRDELTTDDEPVLHKLVPFQSRMSSIINKHWSLSIKLNGCSSLHSMLRSSKTEPDRGFRGQPKPGWSWIWYLIMYDCRPGYAGMRTNNNQLCWYGRSSPDSVFLEKGMWVIKNQQ